MSDSQIRQEFENWCTVKITDAEKAPKAAALVQAYWTAWQVAYAAGRSAGMEEVAGELPMKWTETDNVKFAANFRSANSAEAKSRPDITYRVGWNDCLARCAAAILKRKEEQ